MEVSRGRQPIGVNQPPNSGTNYPFIRPSSDVQHLLGDFYLSYKETTSCYLHPFKISWLYGFGSEDPSSPTGISPLHDHDIQVKDSSGVIVFNSALNDVTYREFVWGDRFLILEWELDDASKTICRATKFLGWDSYSTDAQEYSKDFVPVDGTLDPRTYNKLPPRVESILYGLNTIKGNIEFAEGNNISLAVNPEQMDLADLNLEDFGVTTEGVVSVGKRLTNRINISSEPGDGLGVRVACDTPSTPEVRRIGGSVGNDWQNLTLDSGRDCIRSQRPVGLQSHYPRQFRYAWTTPPGDDSEPESAYELLNDCATCCDCDYFARTYQGLKRQWFLYQDIATDALSARDVHNRNIIRWNTEKECRENDPLRLVTLVQPDCKAVFSLTFGNTSECCLINVHVRITMQYSGSESEDILVKDCEVTKRDQPPARGEEYEGPEEYQLVGDYPVWDIVFNHLSPGEIGRVTFKLCKPCSEGDTVDWTTHVTWEDVLLSNEGKECEFPEVTVDADTLEKWSEAGAPPLVGDMQWHYTKTAITRALNPENAYCGSCDCEGDSIGSVG